jgi:hypothetical protein
MALKKKAKVVEEIQDTKAKVKADQPANKIPEPKVKEKTDKPESLNEVKDDGTIKVDLSKYAKQQEEDKNIAKVDLSKKEENVEKVVEDVKEEVKEENPVIEEIPDDEVEDKVEEVKEEVIEAVKETQDTGKELPEDIQKVINFMDDTGGSLEDYVQLNKDYAKMGDHDLLHEYFKQTKPHLNDEERIFIMEDMYSYNEDTEDEREVKRKKLALKEQVANAKNHLDGLKSKYYNEVKAGSRLNPEQKDAVDFFNRYNENSKITEKNHDVFTKKTNDFFNDRFKGFEYNVGEKRFRLNVSDADNVKTKQLDINNFVNKFTNKQTHAMSDAKGYHKSLFTAMNPDVVANHFYQQGKSDAIKENMANAKNVDMTPNQEHGRVVESGGIKVRAISGDTSADFKVKIGRNTNKIS